MTTFHNAQKDACLGCAADAPLRAWTGRIVYARLGMWVALAATLSCCQPEVEHWRLTVHGAYVDGQVLGGVSVWCGKEHLGMTDAQGHLSAWVAAAPDTSIRLRYRCPSGDLADKSTTHEQRLLLPPQAGSRPLSPLSMHCPQERHEKSIVVRVSPSHALQPLPIRINGEILGQTATDGTAHLQLRIGREQRVKVELDTTSQPTVLPRNPVHTFEATAGSHLWLVDQSFVVPDSSPPAKRQPPTLPAPPLTTYSQ